MLILPFGGVSLFDRGVEQPGNRVTVSESERPFTTRYEVFMMAGFVIVIFVPQTCWSTDRMYILLTLIKLC